MSRRRFMTHHHTGQGTWEGRSTSHVRQETSKTEKAPNLMWLTVTQAASADLFRAQRAHKGLPTTGSEKNNVIGLRLTALHPGRSDGHTRDGQSNGGWSFFPEAVVRQLPARVLPRHFRRPRPCGTQRDPPAP